MGGEIHGPIDGNGHLHREAIFTYDVQVYIRTNHRVTRMVGGRLRGDGRLLVFTS